MDDEESVGVVFFFDLGEAGVVGAPVGMLKIGFEEVAFGDVGSAVGGDGAEFVHAPVDSACGFAALGDVGLVIGNSWIRRALAVGDDSESKGTAHRGIHRGVFCSFDGFRRRARESLIKMKLHLTEAGS